MVMLTQSFFSATTDAFQSHSPSSALQPKQESSVSVLRFHPRRVATVVPALGKNERSRNATPAVVDVCDEKANWDSPERFMGANCTADFMRFKTDQGKSGSQLQTAIVGYRKRFPWSLVNPFLRVDLVSTIHIADKDYFKSLQKELSSYDCVLYEMVASREYLESKSNLSAKKRLKSPRSKSLNIIGCIQRQMARLLVLDFQLDCLNYQSKKWVHADLDFETFKQLQLERGESFFSFARDMTLKSTKAMVQPSSIPDGVGPWRSKLLWASRVLPMPLVALFIIGSVCDDGVRTSKSLELEALSSLDIGAAMKVFLARQLTSEFGQVTSEIEEDSVLIGERNRAALVSLRQAIGDGHKKIAILYGGGHMPDLGRRLREEFDMVPSSVQWITAWSIRNRVLNTDSFPVLETMAKALGWPLNRYQTLALVLFSSVLAVDLLFWELFFGTTVNWVSQVALEIGSYIDSTLTIM